MACKPEGKGADWFLLLVGWAVVLGGSAILIAIRAPRVETLDPIMPFLIVPLWMASLVLVSIGTFRTTRFMKHAAIRIIATVLAVATQGFAYYLIMLVPAVYIHLWAGGSL